MRFKNTNKVETNVDAYNLLEYYCEEYGYKQEIDRGSFEGTSTYRLQIQPIMIEIIDPGNFLYLPKEVTVGMIEKYFEEYLMSAEIKTNEVYTYGSRIMKQYDSVLDMMRNTPNTNQAVISIAQPEDIKLKDPPCLRSIHFGVFNGKLNMSSYWRSNDIGEAFLLNQGGLAMMLKDVAEYAEQEVGSHFYFSSGSHIYVY